MNTDRFFRRSLQTLSDELEHCVLFASPTTVGNLLGYLDYNLHVNIKRFTGPSHPGRNLQFLLIEEMIDQFRTECWPILSVDSMIKS